MGPGGEDLCQLELLEQPCLQDTAVPSTEDSATILVDAANGFVNSGTMTRASLWNYTSNG